MAKANKPKPLDLSKIPTALASDSEFNLKKGVALIKEYQKNLPTKPGVYRMINALGEILYVGKAKNLKNRVATYARGIGHTNQVTRMLAMVSNMEFTITHTEAEALLLEANLIRRLKPKYNVLMRDDKSFPYIMLGLSEKSPFIAKHRGPRAKGNEYFGPFASGFAVTRSLNILQKAFLLRSCSNSEFQNRSRPCMLYQIKRCAAPCVGMIEADEYRKLVDEARLFLRGRSNKLQDDLAEEMRQASKEMEYERAARLRDRIRTLSSIKQSQGISPSSFSQADVFAIHLEGGVSCIEVFFFRAGQNWGNRAYFPRHEKDLPKEEILESFIGQFYQTNMPPDLIILSHRPNNCEILAQALSTLAGSKVKITIPLKGEKKEIIESISNNARETLARKLSESSTIAKLHDKIAEIFDLKEAPKRIEVYDNSHIGGTNAIGAMIVGDLEGLQKSQYRKWNIKMSGGGDDFAMMREVLSRRFARLNEEESENHPDLIIIDGGAIQLKAALDTASELGVKDEIKIISMAKGLDRNSGREEFYIENKAPFRLPMNDAALYYLQRLRDEAHRFAIGSHRQKRARELTKNPLDSISGIGPLRKKALMARFGSAKAVSQANLRDIAATPGVSEELAQRIFEYFQN